MAVPSVLRISGRAFSKLFVNNILIICDLSSLGRSLFLTAAISLNFVMSLMESFVFVPDVAKNSCNG